MIATRTTTKVTRAVPEWQRPVISVPLNQAFPQLGEVKEYRNKKCLFNHNRTKLFDVVSDRYQTVSHSDALGLVAGGLKKIFARDIEMSVCTLRGGARVRAEFKIPMAPIKLVKGDLTNITVVVNNSYDRSCPFSAVLGAFRLVCSNGMTIGESLGSVKAKHLIHSEGEDADPLSILPDLGSMLAKAPTLQDTWLEWRDTQVDFDQAFEFLQGQFPAKYLNPVLDESKYPKSKWDLYNELTYFSTHNTNTLQRRIEFDERISKLFYPALEEEM